MGLRWKVLAVVGFCFLGLSLVLFTLFESTLMRHFNEIERNETEGTTERLVLAIQQNLESLGVLTNDWAESDSAYRFAGGQSSDFVSRKLDRSKLLQAEIAQLYVANNSGRVTFSKFYGAVATTQARYRSEIEKFLTSTAVRSTRDGTVTGYVLVNGDLMLVAASPIVGMQGSRVRGWLVFVRDQQQVQQLGAEVAEGASLKVYPVDAAVMADEVRAARRHLEDSSGVYIRTAGMHAISGFSELKGAGGAPVGIIRIELPRSMHKQGLAFARYLLAALLLVALVFAALAVYIIERFFLHRVFDLKRAIQKIGLSGDLSERLDIRGTDEVSTLTRAINRMLGQLQHSARQLRDSEERFRALSTASYEGIAIHDNRNVIEVNDAALELMGYDRTEVLGQSIEHFLAPRLHALGRKVLTREISGPFEATAMRKDGTPVTLEIRSRPMPYRERKLQVIAIRDVTQRKEAERALREREESYRRLVELAREGIMTVSAGEVITFTNPAMADMLGYTTDELQGSQVQAICDQLSLSRHAQETERRLNGETSTYELRLVCKDGSAKDFIVTASPLVDKDGNYEGALGVLTDITERKHAEETLLHAQKLESLGVLAGGIAHDFNNLLVGILGNAGFALESVPLDSPARRNINDIELATLRAADLVRQMLAYAGKGQFVIEAVSVSEVVGEMGQLLSAATPKHVKFNYTLDHDVAFVEADAAQIRQVAMNLILNAAEAIGDRDGLVQVRTGVLHASKVELKDCYIGSDLPEGDYVYIKVSDNGCGMDSETRSRVFDPFFTTKFTGRGLGLAAVLGIVRSHNGAIRLESEQGIGTTFTVMFAPTTRRPAVREERQPVGHWSGSGTVLVVDDEPTVRMVAERILSQKGFKVLGAADGLECLEVFAQHSSEIDLVLLDMTMPRLSGEEVLELLRASQPSITVLFTSGYSQQDLAQKYDGSNGVGFIQKPYSSAGLGEKVRQLLEHRGRHAAPNLGLSGRPLELVPPIPAHELVEVQGNSL